MELREKRGTKGPKAGTQGHFFSWVRGVPLFRKKLMAKPDKPKKSQSQSSGNGGFAHKVEQQLMIGDKSFPINKAQRLKYEAQENVADSLARKERPLGERGRASKRGS